MLWVATTSGLILRSYDKGASWDTVLNASTIYTLAAAPDGKIFAGGSGKVFTSTDQGNTWDSIALGFTFPVTKFLITPDGKILAITGALDLQLGFVGAGVVYSDDAGVTWHQRNNGLGAFLSCQQIARDRNGRLYLSCADEHASGNSGLFISDDEGMLWKHIPIFVDGRGVIENKMNVETSTALEITPQDSVQFSFLGVSRDGGSGVLVRLNLRKHISEVEANTFWTPQQIADVNSWWLDRPLNDIHFSRRGDWYSSTSGTIVTGLTYFSQDQGSHWQAFDYGLGLDINGLRNIQSFAELGDGIIFMVQLQDERVYWTDTSVVSSVPISDSESTKLSVFPSLAKRGQRLTINLTSGEGNISIFNMLGHEVFRTVVDDTALYIKAPEVAGVYFIRSQQLVTALIVY